MAELSYEHQLENEVRRLQIELTITSEQLSDSRAMCIGHVDARDLDKAVELAGSLRDRLRFSDQARQDEVRAHAATMERFLGQADTIEDWGARLERIFNRHIRDEDGRCRGCELPWPCEDRKDAEWNSKTTNS